MSKPTSAYRRMSASPRSAQPRPPSSSATINTTSSSRWGRVKSWVRPAIPIRPTLANSPNVDSLRSRPMPSPLRRGTGAEAPSKRKYYELASRLVRGQTLLAKVLHDASVGLDYLVSRPEVDTGRIGFLGHSYGGRMAIWLAALDRRIRATVSHCGCVGYADSLRRGAGIQMEFCVPGFMRHAEIEDIVALVAPTPLLLSAAIEDRWSRGAQRIYEAAKPAFANSDLELILWPGGHAFTRPMRDAAYGFLEKHLDVQHLRGDRPPNSSTAGQSIDSYPSSFRAK